MMLAFRLWLRRSTTFLAAPAMLTIVLVMIFSRSGWAWERGHAISWVTSTVVLLAPCAAGLVAFDMWRRETVALRVIARGARRGVLGTAHLVLVTWLITATIWGVGIVIAVALTEAHDVGGSVPWWDVARGLSSLLASVCIGAAIGSGLRNVAAAPLAAVTVYLIPIIGTWLNVGELTMAGGATEPLIGITRDPRAALLGTVAVLLIAATSWQLVQAHHRREVLGTVAIVFAALASVVTLGFLHTSMKDNPSGYVASNSPEVCVGDAPQVCGPSEGQALFALAADGLAAAADTLDRDGIPVRHRYDFVGGQESRPPQGAGLLTMSVQTISDGRLGLTDVALTIATPTACPQFYADVPPESLLAAQGSVAAWLVDRLSGEAAENPSNLEGARAELDALAACDEERAGSWTYAW